jgi:hypothetical protein
MAFNPSPSSWLSNYSFSQANDTITFDLDGNFTASMSDPLKFIFRVADYISTKYSEKPSSDRPSHWVSASAYIQPTQTAPNTVKTLTNTFVLDAALLSELLAPTIPVTLVTADMVYYGFSYGAATYTAPTGSSVVIEYSSDGALTWSQTPPTDRGSYYARITATLNGRSGTATSQFSITKNTPIITAPSDITQVFSSGTISVSFAPTSGTSNFTSVTSSNPSAVSVVSFTQQGAVTLQKNGVGEAVITARSPETSEFYPSEGSFTVSLTKIPSVITAPSTLTINASSGLSQSLSFSTNFQLTTARWNLIQITSSNTAVATITKGSSYPATINILTAGDFEIEISYPGDSEYDSTSKDIAVTINGISPSMVPSLSGSNIIASGEQLGTTWATGKLATLVLGTDSDSNGEADGQVQSLPATFTISLAQPSSGTGSSGALTYQWTNFFTPTDWITFTQGQNSVQATITSLPGTTSGQVNGGQLRLIKAPANGILGWEGSFDIDFYKVGPRITVLQTGFFGQANSTYTEITSNALSLNANAEYGTEWSVSEECCPHVAYLKFVGADGAPTGNVNISLNSGSQQSPVTFEFGALSKTVQQNTPIAIQFHYAGTSTLSVSYPGTSQYNKSINLNIAKISSSMTTAIDSVATQYSICCEPVQANCPYITAYPYASSSYDPTIVISTTPENIAWDGLTTSRITITHSDNSITNVSKIQANNGVTLAKVSAESEGESTMTASLATTNKYSGFTITRSIKARKPLLRATKGTFAEQYYFGNSTCSWPNQYPGPTNTRIFGHDISLVLKACNNSSPSMQLQSGYSWENINIPLIVQKLPTSGQELYAHDCLVMPITYDGGPWWDGNGNGAPDYFGVGTASKSGRLFKSPLEGFTIGLDKFVTVSRPTVVSGNAPTTWQYTWSVGNVLIAVAGLTGGGNYLNSLNSSCSSNSNNITGVAKTNHPLDVANANQNWPASPVSQTNSALGTFYSTAGSGGSYNVGLAVWASPSFPYRNGYLGDYFSFDGLTQSTLEYGVDFDGIAGFGSEYFSLNQEVEVFNILI